MPLSLRGQIAVGRRGLRQHEGTAADAVRFASDAGSVDLCEPPVAGQAGAPARSGTGTSVGVRHCATRSVGDLVRLMNSQGRIGYPDRVTDAQSTDRDNESRAAVRRSS